MRIGSVEVTGRLDGLDRRRRQVRDVAKQLDSLTDELSGVLRPEVEACPPAGPPPWSTLSRARISPRERTTRSFSERRHSGVESRTSLVLLSFEATSLFHDRLPRVVAILQPTCLGSTSGLCRGGHG
ncbi:hypothetical protein ACH47B_28755 [Rhodococcus sp. NPDC019627]|uniref:hypothetical protein n=1 Tax=unclassified Rhodococcus (in: high G+C Gram-positive bacteria) TaxID=192944 RepID=UPI0033CA79D7